jgi:hypothetical protein
VPGTILLDYLRSEYSSLIWFAVNKLTVSAISDGITDPAFAVRCGILTKKQRSINCKIFAADFRHSSAYQGRYIIGTQEYGRALSRVEICLFQTCLRLA